MEYTDSSRDAAELVEDGVSCEPPRDYKVILLNDDFTTKEFVVWVLQKVFHKTEPLAEQIMEAVHRTGSGVAGVYPYDIAATRAQMTVDYARKEGFPLRCTLEGC